MTVFLEPHQLTAAYRLIDTRFSMQQPDQGRQAYDTGHIHGAIYWDLNTDLSDLSNHNGRHPLPSKAQLQRLFESSGLRYDQPIAIYDGGAEPYATRAYWLLSYAGFERVYVVNGGYPALVAAGYPVDQAIPAVTPSQLTITWREGILADREEVQSIVGGTRAAVLLDAREAARYAGQMEPIDPIAGRIPGARNYYWGHSRAAQRLIVTDQLQQTVTKDEPVVVYCGSGVTASPLYALLKEAGYDQVKMYVGSYSDWIRHNPVEKDTDVKS